MSLPLKIRVTIRDHWDSKESPLREQFEKVQELVGLPIWCEPQWLPLLEELKAAFPDQSVFVPTIASVVTAWATALCDVAGDDENEDWVEEMLEKVGGRNISLALGVGRDRPTTFWNGNMKAFEICFPKNKVDNARTLSSVMTAGFHADLRKAFKAQTSSSHARTPSRPQAPVDAIPDAGDSASWVDAAPSDIDSASVVGLTPAATEHHAAYSNISSSGMAMRFASPMDTMPTVTGVERPEDLTMKAPYHMIMRWSESKVIIHGSHQPSLELISEYLKKWAKRNHQITTKPPVAEVNLRGSCFGLGTMFDRVEIETQHRDMWNKIDPTIMLSLIETVLGYRMTFQEGFNWHFRRETAFR